MIMLKMFKGMWFLSALTALAALLYVYASLPEEVMIQQKATSIVSLSREVLFYVVLAVIVMVNVLVYIFSKVFKNDVPFRTWFHGLLITLNIFFMVVMFFINVFNSKERFDYNSIGFVIYGSVALIVLWAAAWPMYSLYRRFFVKSLVL